MELDSDKEGAKMFWRLLPPHSIKKNQIYWVVLMKVPQIKEAMTNLVYGSQL